MESDESLESYLQHYVADILTQLQHRQISFPAVEVAVKEIQRLILLTRKDLPNAEVQVQAEENSQETHAEEALDQTENEI